MYKIFNNKIFIVAVLLVFAFVLPPMNKITVYLIGDSTMCNYEPSRAPITGWGMPFKYFFDSSVIIDNRARGGRSTRTFLSENLWQNIVDNLHEGDYVMIQFGHNDEAKSPQYAARYTSVEDYKINLAKFITESISKKAKPVLITPVTRMSFNKQGIQQETHIEYTAACYQVSKQYNVPLIDLDKKSRDLLNQFGPENAKLLFMQLGKEENPHYLLGQMDNTHFNDFGARKIAELVLKGIKELKIDLTKRIIIPQIKSTATPIYQK